MRLSFDGEKAIHLLLKQDFKLWVQDRLYFELEGSSSRRRDEEAKNKHDCGEEKGKITTPPSLPRTIA